MDRRAFVTIVGGSIFAVPLSGKAQQPPTVPRIGVLEANPGFDKHLHAGLNQYGYVEGKNIVIEWRWAHASAERFPELATELVRLKAEVIVAANNPAVAAAQDATKTIPIVMVIVTDPVRLGFVTSLARPAGNITGLTIQSPELAGKRLQLLKEAVPHLTRVAVLWDPTEPGRRELVKETEAASPTLGLQLQTLAARSPQEIDSAFAAMTRERAGALVVLTDSIFTNQRRQIAELATKRRLPSIFMTLEYAEAGGLMAYSANFLDVQRRAATFVDKILKGAKPADLPIEQPTKFDFVINLKTAKALGLTIPPSMLLQADRVIE